MPGGSGIIVVSSAVEVWLKATLLAGHPRDNKPPGTHLVHEIKSHESPTLVHSKQKTPWISAVHLRCP